MGVKELCQKYRRPHPEQAINAAIRAEIPGGGVVLDLLHQVYPQLARDPERLQSVFDSLRRARTEMAENIAARYGLKSANKGECHAEASERTF